MGTIYAMQVCHMRDGIVSVSTQPCRETRRVSFSDRLLDALPVCEQSNDILVQSLSIDRQVERLCSSESQEV